MPGLVLLIATQCLYKGGLIIGWGQLMVLSFYPERYISDEFSTHNLLISKED